MLTGWDKLAESRCITARNGLPSRSKLDRCESGHVIAQNCLIEFCLCRAKDVCRFAIFIKPIHIVLQRKGHYSRYNMQLRGTYREIDDLPWNHHMEELFRGCWQCGTDSLSNTLGDYRDATDVLLLHLILLLFNCA